MQILKIVDKLQIDRFLMLWYNILMKMAPTYPIKIYLSGKNSNSYAIIGYAKDVLRKNGVSEEAIEQYYELALHSDYKTLISITKQYVGADIEFVE